MSVIKGSAMRMNLILASASSAVVLLAVAAYIIIAAIKETSPAWTEMGVFAAGIAAILTGVSYSKAKQKETEVKENGNKEL